MKTKNITLAIIVGCSSSRIIKNEFIKSSKVRASYVIIVNMTVLFWFCVILGRIVDIAPFIGYIKAIL